MKRDTLLLLASLFDRPNVLKAELLKLLPTLSKGWKINTEKLLSFLDSGKPRFSLFVKGNSKLPFVSWSVLPLVSCEGKGACASYCYSLKAWRYPAAFFRQLQNLILLQTYEGKVVIADAFAKIKAGSTVRLYVDGDFDSYSTLGFWFNQAFRNKSLNIYGYSKSWELFLKWNSQGLPFPSNYTLNLSSGSKYGEEVKAEVAKLPCVRGEFIAYPVSNSEKKGKEAYRAELLAIAKAKGIGKAFVCPSKCGDCLHGKHACGNAKLSGVSILIGVH